MYVVFEQCVVFDEMFYKAVKHGSFTQCLDFLSAIKKTGKSIDDYSLCEDLDVWRMI